MEIDEISSELSDYSDHYDKNLILPVELDNLVTIIPPTKKLEIKEKLIFLWNMFLSKNMNIFNKYEQEYCFLTNLNNGFQSLDVVVVEDPEISFYEFDDNDCIKYDVMYKFYDGDIDYNLCFGYYTYENNTKQKIFIHDYDFSWLSKSYKTDFIGSKMKLKDLSVENISKNLKNLIDKIIEFI